jgi:KDO2-lipid IV(A) lauroyltransferase
MRMTRIGISSLRHAAEAFPLLVLSALAALLPFSWLHPAGSLLGRLFFDFFRLRRGQTLRNIALAWGDGLSSEQRVRIARAAYRHFGGVGLELIALWRQSPAKLAARADLRDIAVIREALQGGKGALLVTGHFGSWEVIAGALQGAGIPLSGYAGRQHNPIVNRWINFNRARAGNLPIHKDDVKGLLAALKQNRLVAMVMDQHDSGKRYYVRYFGHPVSVAPGPAMLARRTGAAIVFCTCLRGEDGRYQLRAKRIETAPSDDKERDVLNLTQAIFDELEQAVRAAPGQYFWMHRRWRPIPESVHLSAVNREFLAGRVPASELPSA